MLQQHLPFTVLKQEKANAPLRNYLVATTPTVYGIETRCSRRQCNWCYYRVATTPTVYGIETAIIFYLQQALRHLQVATTPTVYGIETRNKYGMSKGTLDTSCNNTYRLRY